MQHRNNLWCVSVACVVLTAGLETPVWWQIPKCSCSSVMKQYTSTKQTSGELPLQRLSLCITLPRQWKINISATKMSALPCSLCFLYTQHCCSRNCGYFCVNRADVLMRHLDITCHLEGWLFLAWCLSSGWCCCSQVRCSSWLKIRLDNCISLIEWPTCKLKITCKDFFFVKCKIKTEPASFVCSLECDRSMTHWLFYRSTSLTDSLPVVSWSFFLTLLSYVM